MPGIDAFLASREVKDSGKVIGIDFTGEMLHIQLLPPRKMDLPMLSFEKEI